MKVLGANDVFPPASPSGLGTTRTTRFTRGSLGLRFILELRVHANVIGIEDVDVNHIRPAADGTVFDVGLLGASSQINRDDNVFATGSADVTGFRSGIRARSFAFTAFHWEEYRRWGAGASRRGRWLGRGERRMACQCLCPTLIRRRSDANFSPQGRRDGTQERDRE
jgi:hypothetical protein